MIKINLLGGPKARAGKKQWDVEMEAAAGVAVIVLTLGGWFYYSGVLDDQLEAKQVQIREKQKQIAVLKEKVKEVEDFEAKKKLLEDKNRVIEQLEKARGGPVRAMDYISQSLEPLKLWITRMNVTDRKIELEGKGLTNNDVIEFVNNLRRTDYFTNIQLQETRQSSERKVNVYQFKLDLTEKR